MEAIKLDVLDGVLERYSARLEEVRVEEVYKWEAVRHFKETWDPDADDLGSMLEDAFQHDKKVNIVYNRSYFPIGMLSWFAHVDGEGTLRALNSLFDEGVDLKERMVAFESWAKGMLARINEERAENGESPIKSHFQDPRAMSVYLAFMHPETHYLYKANMYREAATFLGVGYPGNKFDKVVAYREMCAQILDHMERTHGDLVRRSDELLGDLAAYDPEHRMLTQDIVFFITEYDKKAREANRAADNLWRPTKEDYDPDIDAEAWSELLKNRDVFTDEALRIANAMLDVGGSATCTQLAERFGGTKESYNAGMRELGRRVAMATGCPTLRDKGGSASWWAIPCVGRNASTDEPGVFVWKLRDELVEALTTMTSEEEDVSEVSPSPIERTTDDDASSHQADPYTDEGFLREVYVSEEDLADMRALLERKRNLVLQGSPGTGKTFCAKRLAWAIMGERDESRITFVQFHQSTTYDDLVCGYRPDGSGGFVVRDGPFVRACHAARRDSARAHFFIIDEINRANVSKVFGELLMLIEADHRGSDEVLLTVSGQRLSVPTNLYVIGMMNTADRGLALIDYALRRRFAFFEMAPALENERFLAHVAETGGEAMLRLVEATKEVNEDISADPSLGDGFRIGHSYFCGGGDPRLVVRYELSPLVDEYWFDDTKAAAREKAKLEAALR